MSIATEIRKLEEQLLRSDFRHDRDAVSEVLAEDFREFGSSGRVWNKQQILDQLETEPAFDAAVQDFEVTELAIDVMLVTYIVNIHLSNGERSISLRSSIWIVREGRWQIIFHQGTRRPAE